MENIEKALNLLSRLPDVDLADEQTAATVAREARAICPAAIKEFDALKAAGVEVKIEQVERVTVIKPKSKRGGYRPRTKKSQPEVS
jgi:hypothetical protein